MGDFVQDNDGHRVPPGVVGANPVNGSSLKLYDAIIGENIELTVEASTMYVLTSTLLGGFVLGLADATTDANIMWVSNLYETITIWIPPGVTTLHYNGITNGATGYLRKVY